MRWKENWNSLPELLNVETKTPKEKFCFCRLFVLVILCWHLGKLVHVDIFIQYLLSEKSKIWKSSHNIHKIKLINIFIFCDCNKYREIHTSIWHTLLMWKIIVTLKKNEYLNLVVAHQFANNDILWLFNNKWIAMFTFYLRVKYCKKNVYIFSLDQLIVINFIHL